jgi:predicted transcriptional regulator
LIEWIARLSDVETIAQLRLSQSNGESTTDWWDDLSEMDKASISRGLIDLDAGRPTPHAEAEKFYERWL